MLISLSLSILVRSLMPWLSETFLCSRCCEKLYNFLLKTSFLDVIKLSWIYFIFDVYIALKIPLQNSFLSNSSLDLVVSSLP